MKTHGVKKIFLVCKPQYHSLSTLKFRNAINHADCPMLKSPTECDNENNDDDHDNNGKTINFSNTSASIIIMVISKWILASAL